MKPLHEIKILKTKYKTIIECIKMHNENTKPFFYILNKLEKTF